MISGVLNIRKERGMTSHDVVAILRKMIHQKKIGHTGTLDPDAEGVLPVCLGSATRLCDLISGLGKAYRAVMLLGTVTNTEDITGEIIRTAPVLCSEEDVRAAVLKYTGEISQVPPMYSAIKVNGRKLYEYARKGQEIERKPRQVTIYSLDVEKVSLPRVTMRISCSKGTYIRSLCRDIGEDLGCGGCMESLVRITAGGLDIGSSLTLDKIRALVQEDRLQDVLIPADYFFRDIPGARIMEESKKKLFSGNPLLPEDLVLVNEEQEPGKEKSITKERESSVFSGIDRIRVYDPAGRFTAVYQRSGRSFRAAMMFPDLEPL